MQLTATREVPQLFIHLDDNC